MTTEDSDRERRIDSAYRDLIAAQSRANRLSAWEHLRSEVGQRSAERVAEMEIAWV